MGLRNKFSFLLGDNHSVNWTLFLQPALHQNDEAPIVPFKKQHSCSRCLAHIIHLEAVQIISLFQAACHESYDLLQNAVNKMHSSPQLFNRWYELCKKHNKDLRLLPREVKTRWGVFDQLLGDAVEFGEVLEEFVRTSRLGNFAFGFWHFCFLFRTCITKPLRQLTDAVCTDNSLNAMHISMMYWAITSLESGIVNLSEIVKEEKQSGQAFHLIYRFCCLAENKLGLRLGSYFSWYKKSNMEKFKFLFVPYNVWLYGDARSSHLRELLGWGSVADLERFLLETLNDRVRQPHSTSMFSLRLAMLNGQTIGTNCRVSNVVETAN